MILPTPNRTRTVLDFGTAEPLATWLLGMVGVYRVGDLAHVFLLVGLMLLLLAMLKARDAALRPPNPPTED